MNSTINYYNENAELFIDNTVNIDMSSLYKRFDEFLEPGCRIMDLGCGSGRDSKYFKEKGYDVVAIDASEEMCKTTRRIAGVQVIQEKIEDLAFKEEFNAVWACASLLHIRKEDITKVLNNVMEFIGVSGMFYSSWKNGNGERWDGERYYLDFAEESIMTTLLTILTSSLIGRCIFQGYLS